MFNKVLKVFMVVCLILSTFALTSCKRGERERITVKGSTTVLPIMQKVSEAYMARTNVSITIEGSGSGNGIQALINSTCDIAMSSREMREGELQSASGNGLQVKEIVVAHDMIVPIIHPSNPVTGFTTAQLKAIYDGSITNWKDLGGRDAQIVVLSRDTSSGTYEIWSEKIMNKADVSRGALLQASSGAVISSVANNPLAIGYVGFGYINASVKGTTVDGIEPLLEHGKSGKFPISRGLYLYISENKISADAKKFLDFVLGRNGQKLVQEAGFIPI